MVKYEFIYFKNKHILDNYENNYNIFKKYASIINQDINQLKFYYKGRIININQKLNLSPGKIKIFVYKKNCIQRKKRDEILCQKCNNLSYITFNEDIIKDNTIIEI